MRRFTKWIVRSLIGVSIIVLLVVIAVALILGTQPGTRWAIDRIDARIPGKIEIERFDGTLWAGLHIPALIYRDAEREFRAVAVELRVSWSSVASGQFVLSVLGAETVEYRNLAPTDPLPKPFELAMNPLPVTVGVTRSRIGGFTLVGQGDSTEIRDILLDSVFMNGNALRAEAVSASTENIALSASKLDAKLAGDVPLSLSINWSLLDDSWSGRGTVRGSLAALEFDHSVTGPYPASISGELKVLHRIEPKVDALVLWEQWSFDEYVLENGETRIRGTADDYDVDYDLAVQLPGGERARISGTATGNTERLTAFEAHAKNQAGSADVAGSIVWRPSFVAEVQVRASSFDPSIVVKNLSGRLDADAYVSVDGSGNLNITDATVTGVLNDAAINARGNVALTPEQIRCDACLLSVGNNRINVDGTTGGGGLGLSLSVDAPSLDLLWTELAGNLKGQGRFTGSRTKPQFTGELHGRQLRFADWSADDIVIRSRASTIDAFDLTATVTTLFGANTDLGSFTVLGKGALGALDVNIDWAFRDLNISATGKVQRSEELIEGVVTRATIVEPNTGNWSLSDQLGFRIRGSDVLVDRHAWLNANGQLRVTHFSSAGDELELVANLVELPLQTANTFLPPNFQLQGSASADIDVAQKSGAWSGSIIWRQEDTILRVLEANEQSTDVQIPRAEFAAELRDGGADISAALTIEPDVTVEVDLALSGFASDSPIVAELRLSGNDWYWVPAVIPTIDNFEGAISATVNASGPLMTPELDGSLNWRAGGLAVPALNVPITDIDLAISGALDGAATVRGSARAGEGDLSIDGRLENLMRSTRSVELAVSGTGAELINWPEYRLWASPDLVVVGTNAGWTINGNVEVPRADIALRELSEEAVILSPDVTVIGREEAAEAPTRFSGEARLVLGERVHVQAFGLDTRLQGDLLIRMPKDRPLNAEGQVTLVDGVFSAYGQKLTIQHGTLTFTGPLDNPLVDVRAVRVIEAFEGPVTAGINLRGRAQSLSSSVFSDPVMAEADALSYLVIGRPLSQATESEGGELSSAAVALGVKQATRITEQIGQALGLDQLTLAGDGGDTTALVAGKQLSSRLHARYAYGVFSRLGTLLLRYRMSRRLTLEAGAGEAQSIDLLYLVEKQ